MPTHSDRRGRLDQPDPPTRPDVPMYDDDAATTRFGVEPESREDRRARQHGERVTVVIVAALAAVVLGVLIMTVAGHGKDAGGVLMWAMLLGTGLAVGFRKRW